jgi:hypothetical protein
VFCRRLGLVPRDPGQSSVLARDRDGIACVSVSHDHDDSADLPFGLHHRINCGSCLIVSPWLVFLSGCDTISDSVVVMYVHVLFPCRSREDFVHIPVEFLFVRWSILFSQRLASNCQRVDKNYAALHVSCSLVKQKHAPCTWTHVTGTSLIMTVYKS